MMDYDGLRAEQAAHKLSRLGLHNTAIVRGGTQAWCREGLPMQSPGWLPSIEGQVQIAIGLVVLLIVAQATLIDPVFLFLLAVLGVSLLLTATDNALAVDMLPIETVPRSTL